MTGRPAFIPPPWFDLTKPSGILKIIPAMAVSIVHGSLRYADALDTITRAYTTHIWNGAKITTHDRAISKLTERLNDSCARADVIYSEYLRTTPIAHRIAAGDRIRMTRA